MATGRGFAKTLENFGPFRCSRNLARDLRLACGVLARNPSFSLVSLFTLSLGIGINTAVFTLYDSLTYRLLPVQAPKELVRVARQSADGVQPTKLSYPEFEHLANVPGMPADFIATSSTQTIFGILTPGSHICEGIKIQFVTDDYFDVLCIRAVSGQTFHKNDKAVVVVSYEFWRRRLNEGPGIAGRIIRLGNSELTIVGVMPKGFYGTDLPPHMPDLGVPLGVEPAALPGADRANVRTARALQVLARRRSAATLHQIAEEVREVGGAAVLPGGRKSWLTARRFRRTWGRFGERAQSGSSSWERSR